MFCKILEIIRGKRICFRIRLGRGRVILLLAMPYPNTDSGDLWHIFVYLTNIKDLKFIADSERHLEALFGKYDRFYFGIDIH